MSEEHGSPWSLLSHTASSQQEEDVFRDTTMFPVLTQLWMEVITPTAEPMFSLSLHSDMMSLAGGKIASFLDKKQWESVTEWRNWDGWQIGRKVLSKITCRPIHLIFYSIDTSNRYH